MIDYRSQLERPSYQRVHEAIREIEVSTPIVIAIILKLESASSHGSVHTLALPSMHTKRTLSLGHTSNP